MGQSKLLDIAVREFGRSGLEGASTRRIAAAAGTALSAITYHYGGKEGLYLAAADHIAGGMGEAMADVLGDGDCAESGAGRTAIKRIMARLADKMASEESADWALFIVREQIAPSAAFERIYAGMMGQAVRRLAHLIAVATGADPRTAKLTTMTLIGQALAIRASRATMLRLLDLDTLDAATAEALKVRILANTDAILTDLAGEHKDPQ